MVAGLSATGMHPCRRGRAAGGVGAAGDDQGPATARQQGPGRTDADITAWGGQGSGGSAAGDPTARPRGPPPTGPASRPVGTAARQGTVPLSLVPGGAVAGGRGPADGRTRPGADRAAGTGPGISPPGRLATVRPEETMNIIVRF